MNNVYLGTTDFAATVLRASRTPPHRPRLVVTRPDAKQGRGQKLSPPPVAVLARELGIEVIQPEDLHAPEVLQRIADARPEVLTTCAYGVLIKEPLLSDYEMINVHPSLLPRWRGAAPIERAIMAGDAETGVAIMRVTAGWDSGPVYAIATEPIHPDDDYGTLSARLERLGAELLVKTLDEHPAPRRAGRVPRPLRAQDRPARARAGPDAAAGAGRAHDPRPAPAHRLAPAAARRHLPRRARARASAARRSPPPAAASAPTATACCSTATAARSS